MVDLIEGYKRVMFDLPSVMYETFLRSIHTGPPMHKDNYISVIFFSCCYPIYSVYYRPYRHGGVLGHQGLPRSGGGGWRVGDGRTPPDSIWLFT